MLISVAEYESMQETLDILSDDETLSDLRSPAGHGRRGDRRRSRSARHRVRRTAAPATLPERTARPAPCPVTNRAERAVSGM